MCGTCASHHFSHKISEHTSDFEATRRIEVDILAKNTLHAEQNRTLFHANDTIALNLVSSPGSGKTTLLVATIKELQRRKFVTVIEGDQQTSLDADRIRSTGASAIQINTGSGCHLDASMVGQAAKDVGLKHGSILFIENVGNLVCPAAFDLGEAHKVVILSVTEGDDKPLKYPDAFSASDLMILSKIDLLPHVDFDVERCVDHARSINPKIDVLTLSSRTGEGMQGWFSWIDQSAERLADEAVSHAASLGNGVRAHA